MNKFNIEENGYKKEEVHIFINDVIKQTEGMLAKLKEQDMELKAVKSELSNYKSIEATLKSAIYKAEETSVNIKKQAIEQGNILIEEAKVNASRIVNDSLIRAEKIEMKADVLETNIKIFKKKLKLIVEQQLSVVEEIETLDLK
ncbi:MAG: DivIVA domain-containing protein [Bacilli bacterium]